MFEDAQQFYQEIIEQFDAGMLVTDVNGEIVFVNPSFARLSGYQAEAAVGKKIEQLLEGEIKLQQHWEGEVYIPQEDGKSLMQWLYVNPIVVGKKQYHVFIFRDFHVCGFDPLTKLPNRLMLTQKLTASLKRAREMDQSLAVLFLDLDRFKFVNDTLGHKWGDQLLQEAAERIQLAVGPSHLLVRMGGDEFVVVIEDLKGDREAEDYAQKIIDVFAKPFQLNRTDIYISVSVGIGIYPYDGDEVETLVTNADSAMYRAKRKGRNRFEKAKMDMTAGAFERLLLENSLRKAIDAEELTLFFQPQIDLRTNQVSAVEALIRWNHPELGMISPGDFIPIAEETGLILPIGDWVLRTACEKMVEWQRQGFPPMKIAVNLSALQFLQKDLVEKIEQILQETSMDPHFLELEITENMVMQDVEAGIRTLKRLKEKGIHISIDDFGTGYSTLSYLKDFPVDTLKIDRSFIKDIDKDKSSSALTKTIITLAHELNLNVIAEGVETYKQLSLVKKQSCDAVQGFYYSKPLSSKEISQYFQQAVQALVK